MRRRRPHRLTTLTLTAALALSGCTAPAATTQSSADTSVVGSAVAASPALFDSGEVHTIEVEVDDDALTQMIQTYLDTGDKEWIRATVIIDGQTFEDVGIKLKGNSSLRGISVDTPPAELPLRIRLDKFVDGQTLAGYSDVTVRSNTTDTAMNEAVSLDLLSAAGLASTEAVATRFSVNGSAEELRLTVQNLDDAWLEGAFPDAGEGSILYKSEAEGDWSWRGEDGDYSTAFDIEAGDEGAGYAPLIELLDLLNNGTEEEIAEHLPDLLDLESFATYLAVQEIIQNTDDIDGPGNNSYLFWDSATEQFTVVAWDHNLSFGAMMGGGGAGGQGRQGQMPADGEMPTFEEGQLPERPEGMEPPTGGGQMGPGGGMTRENALVTAFTANAQWQAMYDEELSRLQEELVDGGALEDSLDAWVATLTRDADDLVGTGQVEADADAIRTSAS
ncbi:CotH kinase family protein [Serinicoccus kebangsaanensis]|uniref:CotH kinase family protein n=1 Tax=Serinicoccus kebangsaanensis TaxID=2602069 RepID=UPI00124F03CA|nr:CotH kinase family protein [Serinicoccus kebangsaanensis]